MDITPLIPQGRQVITGYGEGGFKINQHFVKGSLLIFPDRSLHWAVNVPEELTVAALEAVLADGGIELLLIGTGKHIAYVDTSVRQALRVKNIGADIMDTGAACRTYNVLVSEERRVAAALIAV